MSYRVSHVGSNRGGTYDARYQEGAENFYWQNIESPLLNRIFERLGRENGGRYMDFACGTGRILAVGAKYFDESTGVDISPDMLQQAQGKCPNSKLVETDVTTSADDLGKFRVISCFRFILNAEPELVQNALKWLRSSIEEDGVLVVNNHNNRWSASGLMSQLSTALGRQATRAVLSDREMRKILRGHGFRVEKTYGFGIMPVYRNRIMAKPAVLLCIENFLGKIPLLRRLSKDRIYVCTLI